MSHSSLPVQSNRVAIFIDGTNFFYLQKTVLGWWCDPKRILDYVHKHIGNIVSANYYITSDPESPQYDNMEKFAYALRNFMGYDNVVFKHIKVRERDGQVIRKASIEVELVTDLAFKANQYDIAVIVSSNSEYIKPIEALMSCGKRVIILNSDQLVGQRLIHSIEPNDFIDFNDIRDYVERQNMASSGK